MERFMKEGYTTIEINMEDWPVDFLYFLIKESCERNISVNQIITETLQKFIDKYEDSSECI